MTVLARRGLRAVRFAAGLAIVGLAFPVDVRAQPAPVERAEISARPIHQFKLGSGETRFGSLEFVGGLELGSGSWNFGAMSAIRFLDPGQRFVGVTDTGFWYFGRLVRDEAGRPSGFADFTLQQMVDDQGDVIGRKWTTDAEGLAVNGDEATVGFERAHRISVFRLTPKDMKGPLRDLDFLVPAHELRRNRGFETVLYAPAEGRHEGARIVISEKSLDRKGDIFGAILEGPTKGIFTVRRSGDFDITDGAFLPDGDLLLLERSYSVAKGVAIRLKRIEGDSIGKGKVADGPVLLEADMGYQIDNMEGLDVWRRADGAVMVSLISDDNHSILQRNLYLEFRLHEE
ncbi:hypothetical protein C7T96_21160 [Nitratireductor sp. StC3]|nr:hypothetical protein C7T96_21160 [Nitratireductor sp. StC3]